MAIAFVQHQPNAGNNLATLTSTAFASPTTAGNTILVTTITGSISRTVVSVSDSGGNTYFKVAAKVTPTSTHEVWAATNIKTISSLTVTVTWNSVGASNQFVAEEYSGIPYPVIDSLFAGAASTDATPTAGPMPATSFAQELILCSIYVGANDATALAAGTGYSNFLMTVGLSFWGALESRVTSSVGAYSGIFSWPAHATSSSIFVIAFCPGKQPVANNYQQVSVGDGMSVSEKIR